MNRTIDQSSFDSSDAHRFSTSEFVPHRNTNPKLHQSLDATASGNRTNRNGLDFYRPPNNDYMFKKGPSYKISRAKINTFLDQHAKSLKYVPCSTKYGKLKVWDHPYNGKFKRTKRITMSQHFIDHSNDTPASNKYKTERVPKIHGNYKR